MHVTLKNLGHQFRPDHWIFENVTAQFTPGTITALTGPSGSGKSTLLSIIAGWEHPTTGRVTRDGIHKTNWVFQNSHGVARRPVIDHLVWPQLARGIERTAAIARAQHLLTQFRLQESAHERFSSLSGGEAQRLMLARAFAAQPNLLLIDEPTAQLDRATATLVNTCIRNVAHEHTIVIVATHDLETARNCDTVLDLGSTSTSTSTSTK